MVLPDGTVFLETWEYGMLKDHRKLKDLENSNSTAITNSTMNKNALTPTEGHLGNQRAITPGPANNGKYNGIGFMEAVNGR